MLDNFVKIWRKMACIYKIRQTFWIILGLCLANVCQAGTYMRFDTRDKPLPYCQFDYLDFVDKDRISKIYNPIYIDKPVQIMVTSPTYFGWSWAGLTPLTGLKIKSYQGEIKPEIFKDTQYHFTLKPLPKAGEFYYFTGKLTTPIHGLKLCVKAVE